MTRPAPCPACHSPTNKAYRPNLLEPGDVEPYEWCTTCSWDTDSVTALPTESNNMTLKIYDDLIQGTDEWLEARRGILTASTIGQLITPARLQPANNDTSKALIRELVAERITGYTEPAFVSADMEKGTFVEPYVRDFYAEHHAPVQEVGFMVRTINGHRLGYSPDGLVRDDGLIEIKSRKGHIQLKAFLENEVPSANMAQIQAGLLVSGRKWCDYVSYCGDMPLYVKRVHPIPKWQDAITRALEQFETTAAEHLATYQHATKDLPVAERIYYDEMMI